VPVTALLALPIVPCCGAAGLTGLFTGVFFTGVGCEAGDEAVLGGWLMVNESVSGFFNGVLLTTGVVAGFEIGVEAAFTAGLGVDAAGTAFFVPTGVRTGVAAGFLTGVAAETAGFLIGVAVEVPLAAAGFFTAATGTGFFVPIGVRVGLLATAGVAVFAATGTGFLTAGLDAANLTGFFVPIGVLGFAGVVFLRPSIPAVHMSWLVFSAFERILSRLTLKRRTLLLQVI
jgi:hypothetical protein